MDREGSGLLQRRRQGCGLVAREGFVGGGGNGYLHEVSPDGERDLGAGLFVAEGLPVVVTGPDAAGDRWREADEPGVGEVVGGAGFAAERVIQLGDRCAGSFSGDATE